MASHLASLRNRDLGQLGNSLLDTWAVEARVTAVQHRFDLYFLNKIFAPEKRFNKGCLASLLRERILQYGHSNQTSYSALNTLRGCYIENGFCGFSWNLTGESKLQLLFPLRLPLKTSSRFWGLEEYLRYVVNISVKHINLVVFFAPSA